MQQIILDAEAIQLKINRMATQIVEANFLEKEIVLLGIKDRGYFLAQLLKKEIEKYNIAIHIGSIAIHKPSPLSTPIELEIDKNLLADKCVIIVDDVANSGKTVFYALKPLMEYQLKKLQVAVLVDRQHKQFPIAPDFIGYSLATTLKEMIFVEIGSDVKEPVAYLS